jgi:hypothetical protein
MFGGESEFLVEMKMTGEVLRRLIGREGRALCGRSSRSVKSVREIEVEAGYRALRECGGVTESRTQGKAADEADSVSFRVSYIPSHWALVHLESSRRPRSVSLKAW